MTDNETKPLEPFVMPAESTPAASDTLSGSSVPSEDRLWSALAYWTQLVVPAIMPAILLLSDQTNKNKFVRYHAIHSLALLFLAVIYLIVVIIGVILFGLILPCSLCLTWILFLGPAVPLVYYGIQAYQGKSTEVRWLTPFLRNNHLV